MRIIQAITALVSIGSITLVIAGTVPAQAQDYSSQSCDQLWYARNSIYANAGYCFKTARAIGVFGRRCTPPYGQLSGYDQSRVSQIQMWEGRRGCS
ncbi:MAG: hypothetical protein QOH98_1018 [Methylobacteriaceae bacterium]|jgi:hypothetical protein|nr:hypothetical protein [Methylobacteriaceae bacterium]